MSNDSEPGELGETLPVIVPLIDTAKEVPTTGVAKVVVVGVGAVKPLKLTIEIFPDDGRLVECPKKEPRLLPSPGKALMRLSMPILPVEGTTEVTVVICHLQFF
jgi:hypothetical protein